MKIDAFIVRVEIVKAIKKFNEENDTKLTQTQFFKHFDVDRNWMYACFRKGEMGANYLGKLQAMGIDMGKSIKSD